MKRSLFVIMLALATVAGCSGDGPTEPGGSNNGGTGGTGGSGGSGGGGGGGGGASGNTITVSGVTFEPSSLTVSTGTTVVWNKTDAGVTHTVTPQGHTAFSRAVSSGTGEMLRVTFNTAGTYNYLCEFHSGMTGTVTVQ